MTRGFVEVNPLCRTAVPTISAVGDLISIRRIAHPQLAHVGFAEGIMVAERLGGLDVRPIDYDGVPRITYSDPEVASVGITSAQAARARHQRGRGELPARRQRQERHPGDAGAGQGDRRGAAAPGGQPGRVLGVHLVGSRVGELIAEAQLIFNWDAEPDDVAALIHPHPTQSEIIGEAHLALAGKPLHFHA